MVSHKRKASFPRRRGDKQVEERTLRLVLSEDVFRHQAGILVSVLNGVGEGIVVADSQGKFLLFNPMAEHIIGIGAMDVPSSEWSEKYGLYYPDMKTLFPTEDLPLLRAIQGVETNEVEMFIRNPKVPDGVFVSVTGRPVKDEKGQPLGGVVVFRDISRQKSVERSLRQILKGMESRIRARTEELLKTNQKLKKSNEVHAHLAAMMARETKAPLLAIRESLDLMGEGAAGTVTDAQAETVSLGRRSTDELEWRLANFLSLIKIESEKLPLDLQPADLCAQIAEAGRLMAAVLGKKGLRLTLEVPTDPLTASCDAAKIQEVAASLIRLAAKYAVEGARLSVRLQVRNGEAVLEVENSGPCVKPTERDKLFEAGDGSLHDLWRSGADGVALAVCRHVVERHGGRLFLDKPNGTGSRLTVFLPFDKV